MMPHANSPAAKKNAKMSRYIYSSLVAAAVIYLGFQTYVYAEKIRSSRDVWGETEMNLISSQLNFTIHLYKEITSNTEGNIFLSPFSILVAILMTSLGARENTLHQIYDTLSLDSSLSRDNLHATHRYLLQTFQNKEEYTLQIANTLFGNKDFNLEEIFKYEMEYLYNAKADQLDFIHQSEHATTFINQWVEQQTKNTIKDLIKPGMIDENTRLVLVNAIYFKGQWLSKFDAKKTKTTTFYTETNQQLPVEMMFLSDKFKYGFLSHLNSQVIELPYLGNDLSMIIILPERKAGIRYLESKLTTDVINSIPKKLRLTKLNLYMPKFRLTEELSLGNLLSKMGMGDLFTDNLADLSGISGNKDLHVSHMVHKAFIEVNEEGVEAAAATAVGIAAMSLELPVVFRADHPFMFYIQHRKSGVILFLGRFTQPEMHIAKEEL